MLLFSIIFFVNIRKNTINYERSSYKGPDHFIILDDKIIKIIIVNLVNDEINIAPSSD